MSHTYEKVSGNQAKLSFTIPAEAFDEAMHKAFLKNRGRISIPGFRKGKAPRKIIETMYGEATLQADVLKAPHHGIATLPDEFLSAVGPSVVFVNNLEENVPRFRGSVTRRASGTTVLFSGDAPILLETDGVDWYVRQ